MRAACGQVDQMLPPLVRCQKLLPLADQQEMEWPRVGQMRPSVSCRMLHLLELDRPYFSLVRVVISTLRIVSVSDDFSFCITGWDFTSSLDCVYIISDDLLSARILSCEGRISHHALTFFRIHIKPFCD